MTERCAGSLKPPSEMPQYAWQNLAPCAVCRKLVYLRKRDTVVETHAAPRPEPGEDDLTPEQSAIIRKIEKRRPRAHT